MRSSGPVAATLLTLLFVSLPAPAPAQVFGKNKVQYERLTWSVLETPHLRLHYYAEEESLARLLVPFAESTCVNFDRRFRLEGRNPVPLLLYATHHLFQQTNATPGFVSEGTGGITELIKGRVMIPYTGSWTRLEWVTRHELTHSYMLEKLSRVMRQHRRAQGYMPPLWFIEGLAEYCGTQWDADAEGMLRDAVVSGEARTLMRSDDITGTVLMYKEGQSFLLYVADRFGSEKVFDLLDNWYRADDFETVFRITFGVPLREVDADWFASVRRRYLPMVATLRGAPELAERLTPQGRFNLGPRVLPNADPADSTVRFCHFAAGESGIELRINQPDARGRRQSRRVLRGGQSSSFESFHLFQNRPDASASGLIALSSKHGGRDAIYILNARDGRVLERFDFNQLVSLVNPSLVPGDTAVVFAAQDYSGNSDLYRVRWDPARRGAPDAVRLDRLTHDGFDDVEPDVSPDGRWVAFASDRGERGGHHSLFRLALAGGVPERLSDPPCGDDRQPVYSPDGRWIAYRSTRGGASDLWVRSTEPGSAARRVTSLIGPASDPDWLANGHGLLFTGQHGITFQTYMLAFDPDTLKEEAEPGAPAAPALAATRTTEPAQRYQRRLGFDLVQNAVGFDPAFGGAGGGGQVALSDILGNEQIFLYLASASDRFGGSFLDNLEGGVTYVNQSRRLNWGVGLFRLTQVYDADLDQRRLERRFGIMGLASYPFNRYTRLDGQVLVRHADDHLLRSGDFQTVDLVSNFLTLVHDNSRWSMLGPSAGVRMYLSAGFTRDMTSGAGDFGTLLGELRHYSQPVPQLVLATRVFSQASLGRDAQRFYLGGPRSLPGYDFRTLAGLRTTVVSEELRFPMLSGLTMALPTPWTLPTVSGLAFGTMAWAWDNAGGVAIPAGYTSGTRRDGLGAQGHLGSVGTGFFIGGGYFPALRWTYAWATPDFRRFARRPLTQFSIGFNF
jgi:hypothetical protein